MLAREDLTNQAEVRAFHTKATIAMCKFLLEDVICYCGCIGQITTDDRGELLMRLKNSFLVLVLSWILIYHITQETMAKVNKDIHQL